MVLFPHSDTPPPVGHVRATAPIAVSDLLIAMVYIGADRQVYWAQRLLG